MKLAYSRKGAAAELSISVRMVDYLIANGQIKARHLNRRVLIPSTELVRIIREGIKSAEVGK